MVDFTERHFQNKQLSHASNTELLNQLVENVFPEFDGTLENRHTFIEGNMICRWVDGMSIYHIPKKVELREVSKEEVVIWETYLKMVEALGKFK